MADMEIPFANWSTVDLEYTVAWSKITCWRPMYFAHVFWCYIISLSGIACMVSRMHPSLHKFHAWSGRVYVISMIWATATSLLIHNTGLPPAVLISFVWVLGGMCLAWILIIIHRDNLNSKALALAGEALRTGEASADAEGGMPALVAAQKRKISGRKTACQRVFSLKALHGALMFMSWLNIFGRIFASDQSGDFTCHTQPYFKPGYQDYDQFTEVPVEDPNYSALPWAKTGLLGWGLALSVGPLALSYLVGALWAVVAVCACPKKQAKDSKFVGDGQQQGSGRKGDAAA